MSYTLKVNIEEKTAHVSEGVALGLREERERNSVELSRTVVFKGATTLTALPPYLTLQMMRFFFRCARGHPGAVPTASFGFEPSLQRRRAVRRAVSA